MGSASGEEQRTSGSPRDMRNSCCQSTKGGGLRRFGPAFSNGMGGVCVWLAQACVWAHPRKSAGFVSQVLSTLTVTLLFHSFPAVAADGAKTISPKAVEDPRHADKYFAPENSPFSTMESTTQRIFLGSPAGVQVMDRETGLWKLFDRGKTGEALPSNDIIQILHAASEHRILYVTRGGGLASSSERASQWQGLRDESAAPVNASQFSSCTMVDGLGLVFGTKSAGFSLYDTNRGHWSQFTVSSPAVTKATDPASNDVFDLLYLDPGELLVATSGGIFHYSVDGASSRLLKFKAHHTNFVSSVIRFDPQGRASANTPIVCLTQNGGVFQLKAGHWEPLVGEHGIRSDASPQPAICRLDTNSQCLLVADSEKGWDIYDLISRDWLNPPGAQSEHACAMELHGGRWWIATDTGLRVFNPALKHMERDPSMPDALNSNAITRLCVDEDCLLGLTARGGLWVHQTGRRWKWLIPNESTETPNELPCRVLEHEGRLWLAYESGHIFAYEPNAHEVKPVESGLAITAGVPSTGQDRTWRMLQFEVAGNGLWCLRSAGPDAPNDLFQLQGDLWVAKTPSSVSIKKIAPIADGLSALTSTGSLLFFANGSQAEFFGGSLPAFWNGRASAAAAGEDGSSFIVAPEGLSAVVYVFNATNYSWSREALPTAAAIAELHCRNGYVYAVSRAGGLFRRPAAGHAWTVMVSDHTVPEVTDTSMISAAPIADGRVAVALTNAGICFYTPGTGEWQPHADRGLPVRDIVSVGDQYWYCCTDGSVHVCNPAGESHAFFRAGLGTNCGDILLAAGDGKNVLWVVTSAGCMGAYDLAENEWRFTENIASGPDKPVKLLRWGLLKTEPLILWGATTAGSFLLSTNHATVWSQTFSGVTRLGANTYAWVSGAQGTEILILAPAASEKLPELPRSEVRDIRPLLGSLTVKMTNGSLFALDASGDWQHLVHPEGNQPFLRFWPFWAWAQLRRWPVGLVAVPVLFYSILLAWNGQARNKKKGWALLVFTLFACIGWPAALLIPNWPRWEAAPSGSGNNELLAWDSTLPGEGKLKLLANERIPIFNPAGHFSFQDVRSIDNDGKQLHLRTPAGAWTFDLTDAAAASRFSQLNARFMRVIKATTRSFQETDWTWQVFPESGEIKVVSRNGSGASRRLSKGKWTDTIVTGLREPGDKGRPEIVLTEAGQKTIEPDGRLRSLPISGTLPEFSPKLSWHNRNQVWTFDGAMLSVETQAGPLRFTTLGSSCRVGSDLIEDFGVAEDGALWIKSAGGVARYLLQGGDRLVFTGQTGEPAHGVFERRVAEVDFDGMHWSPTAIGTFAGSYGQPGETPRNLLREGRFLQDQVTKLSLRNRMLRLATAAGPVVYNYAGETLSNRTFAPGLEDDSFDRKQRFFFDGETWRPLPVHQFDFGLGIKEPGGPLKAVTWRKHGSSWKFSFDDVTGVQGSSSSVSFTTEQTASILDLVTGKFQFSPLSTRVELKPRNALVYNEKANQWTLQPLREGQTQLIFRIGSGDGLEPVKFVPDSNRFPWDFIVGVGWRNSVLSLQTRAGLVDFFTRRLDPALTLEAPSAPIPPASLTNLVVPEWGAFRVGRREGAKQWLLYERRLATTDE